MNVTPRDPGQQPGSPDDATNESGGGQSTGPLSLVISFAETLAAGAIGAIALLVFYEVALRYLFNSPTLWTQDLCIYLMLWGAFLGLAPAERAGEHIRIDLLLKKLPGRIQHWLGIATHILVGGFSVLVAWSGLDAAIQSYTYGRESLSLFPVPMWIPQMCIPVGMGLMAVECFRRAWCARTELAGPEQ